MVVAGEAEDRVIAAVAVDVVVAEGDAIEQIDGFGAVRSLHKRHDSFLSTSEPSSITGESPAHRLSDGRRREIVDVVAPRACDLVHTTRRHAL